LNTDTSIVVNVPAGVFPGDLMVQVYLKEGGSSDATFKVYPQTTATTVTPAKAYPGDEVTIDGTDLDITTGVKFGAISAAFTATKTRITTKVPDNATGGNQLITISSPGNPVTVNFNVDLGPVISSMSPLSAKAGDVVTVNGIRFTGSSSVMLGTKNAIFTVVSDTKITFTVPAGSASSKVTVTTPRGNFVSNETLVILIDGLKLPIYDEAITSNWNGWVGGGWGGTKDLGNTSPVKNGSKSCAINYIGNWGVPLQLGGANIPLAPYTTLKISIYGGRGSAGKKVDIGFNDVDGKQINIIEGVWTDYTIPLGDISKATILNFLYIKEASGSTNPDYIIYIDDLGLN
jgi:hypothetical protein